MRRLLLLVTTAALLAVPAAGASAWAPADEATIHPGVMMFTDGAQCTANFVFSDGASTYLGYAAHCAGSSGDPTQTNGCGAPSHPVGTPVEIDGASKPGVLAYSSWVTMRARGETDFETCEFNDFALVRIDPADVPKVNPSVPFWGGPAGVASYEGFVGEDAYSYGNSSLRAGLEPLRPKRGVVLFRSEGGWSNQVYTVTPGIPGDSGSGFMTASGAASGTLSSVQAAPFPASNGVADLPRELAYMRANGGPAASLVDGTEPFDPVL